MRKGGIRNQANLLLLFTLSSGADPARVDLATSLNGARNYFRTNGKPDHLLRWFFQCFFPAVDHRNLPKRFVASYETLPPTSHSGLTRVPRVATSDSTNRCLLSSRSRSQ